MSRIYRSFVVAAMCVGVLTFSFPLRAQTAPAEAQQTRGVFVGAFISAFAPRIAESIADWIHEKVFGEDEGDTRRRSDWREDESEEGRRTKGKWFDKSRRDSDDRDDERSDRDAVKSKWSKSSEAFGFGLNPAKTDSPKSDDASTLAMLIEAHVVSEEDKPVRKLTRRGSNEITLRTDDRFILKFVANSPGLLRAVNVDAKGATSELGTFVIPASEEVVVPGRKAFRMVGRPGEEMLRLTFFPCRAYSAVLVRTRGIVNESQADTMVASDQSLNNTALASIEDCSRVDVTQVASIATRGIQNENFSGGIALTSTAKSESGKVLPVEGIVKVTHKPRLESTPKPVEADSK